MKLILAFAALLLTTPAYAAECAIMSVEDFAAQMKAEGSEIIGGASYSGQASDAFLILQRQGKIVGAGVKDGCIVTQPIPLDTLVVPAPALQRLSGRTPSGIFA